MPAWTCSLRPWNSKEPGDLVTAVCDSRSVGLWMILVLASSAVAGDDVPVALDPEILAPVLEPSGSLISRGIRAAESEAYYRVLDHARQVEATRLEAAAARFLQKRRNVAALPGTRKRPMADFPVFVDLYNNVKTPEIYHGQPVTLRGHLRKLVALPAGDNEYGIETLYEAWLYTQNSQQHPAVVIVTSVPEELQREVSRLRMSNRPILVDGVSATGYFFKMYGYPAQDAYRFAPLVLGQRLVWQPVAPASESWMLYLFLASGGGLISLPIAWFLWRNRKDDRRRQDRQRARQDDPVSLPDFETVSHVDEVEDVTG